MSKDIVHFLVCSLLVLGSFYTHAKIKRNDEIAPQVKNSSSSCDNDGCDRIPKRCSPCKSECKRGWWRTCYPCPTKDPCRSCRQAIPLRKPRLVACEREEKFPLHHAIRERWPSDRIERLLDQVDIDAVDEEHRTALHWAAVYSYPELVELLLIRGADIDIRDYRGDTPLHLAIKRYTPRPADRRKVIKQLLYNGSSMYDRNYVGNNVFDAAYNAFNQKYALYISLEQ